jgi:hypothetical protein
MAILYPAFALAALTFFCVIRLGLLRFSAVRNGIIDHRFFRSLRAYDEPEDLRILSRHVVNLHEAPVLFYVIIIIAYATGTISMLILSLAWIYVALRYAHSYIHLTSNIVLYRFRLFVASQIALVSLWLVVLLSFPR